MQATEVAFLRVPLYIDCIPECYRQNWDSNPTLHDYLPRFRLANNPQLEDMLLTEEVGEHDGRMISAQYEPL